MYSLFLKIYTMPISGTILLILITSLLYCCLISRYHLAQPWKKVFFHVLFALFFLLWGAAILYHTVFSRTTGELVVHRDIFHQLKEYLNGGDKELLRTLWMNVLLFVPGGLLLEALWPRCFPRWVCIPLTILLLTALSVGIEATQFQYALGCVEADDVLCNGLGAALGVLIHETAVILSRKLPQS